MIIISGKVSETVRDTGFGMEVEGTVHHRDMLGNGRMPILLVVRRGHITLEEVVTSYSHRKEGPATRLGLQLDHHRLGLL